MVLRALFSNFSFVKKNKNVLKISKKIVQKIKISHTTDYKRLE